eukprot:6989486-Prymnesium_polylepis.3
MSWYTIVPRASLDMALTLAENGVRCVPSILDDENGADDRAARRHITRAGLHLFRTGLTLTFHSRFTPHSDGRAPSSAAFVAVS